jgi:hypothetical protein
MSRDIGTELLVICLLDELADALTRRDRDAAVAVIDQITAVAGPAYTDRLMRELVAATLARRTRSHTDRPDGGDAR